jgi:hypothetical protein
MVTHMKTTIEISDALLKAAKRSARARGVTLRALVEEGLRRVLRDDAKPRPFRLRRASFRGEGAAADVQDWDAVRPLIYPGRGE